MYNSPSTPQFHQGIPHIGVFWIKSWVFKFILRSIHPRKLNVLYMYLIYLPATLLFCFIGFGFHLVNGALRPRERGSQLDQPKKEKKESFLVTYMSKCYISNVEYIQSEEIFQKEYNIDPFKALLCYPCKHSDHDCDHPMKKRNVCICTIH